jgi:hypothetical protein
MAATKPDGIYGRAIVLAGIGFTVVVAVMLIWLYDWFFVVRNDVIQTRVLSVPDPRRGELGERETEELSTYGWVDEERGIVRIPIERAMDLVVEESAPGRGGRRGQGEGGE